MKSIQNAAVHAAELHKRAIIIDCHNDILMSIGDNKVRLSERTCVPDPETWEPPMGITRAAMDDGSGYSPHTYYFGCAGQYSLHQFFAGGLTVPVCSIYLEDRHLDRALQRGLELTWCMHREIEENDNFELVTSAADIRRLKHEGKCGAILAFEGFEPVGFDLHFLDLYYKLGLRMASFTQNRRNIFADGLQRHIRTGGLTDLGKQAVKRMNELGIVIDLGHMNQVGFWEILEITQSPVVLSHTSSRKLFPLIPEQSPWHPARDVSRGRERLEALAKNGGVVGAIFFGKENIDEIVTDIEYVIDLVGPDHIGLGSDLYGLDNAPKGLEDISKLPALTEALVRRGHSDEIILKFLGGNLLRVFEQVLGN